MSKKTQKMTVTLSATARIYMLVMLFVFTWNAVAFHRVGYTPGSVINAIPAILYLLLNLVAQFIVEVDIDNE